MASSDLNVPPTMLSIVVPCFDEEAVLKETYARLVELRGRLVAKGKISARSDIVFVDDGSRDRTWPIIDAWVREGAPVVGVKLSRNRGHQNALLAGLLRRARATRSSRSTPTCRTTKARSSR